MYKRIRISLLLVVLVCCESVLAGNTNDERGFGFITGIFSVDTPTDKNFAYVKSLGFDYIHRYTLANAKEEFIETYMELAAKHGLRVMFDVSGPLRELNKGKITEQQALEQFEKLISRWKNHKALGFWYIYDEPNRPGMPPERLMKFHKIVKEQTPTIPDAIAIAWIKNWWDWTKCADIIMPDYYPVRKAKFPGAMLNYQTEFYGKVSKYCDVMIPFVQCFGFPRYPNRIEMRYIMFAPLAQGAEGIVFWSYWRSRMKPFLKNVKLRPDYLEKTVKPILSELKQFVKLIEPVRDVLYVPNLAQYSNKQLIVGVWKRKGKIYILMINNWPMGRQVSFTLKPYVKQGRLEPLCSTRNIDGLRVGRGIVSLYVLPWETFVWRVSE